jgi:hypothetical protein
MMDLTTQEAKDLAIDFLLQDLNIPDDDREFFSVLSAHEAGSEWYVVEVGIEGLPDKWAIQVYDTRECDPCYAFVSPMPASEDADLEEFPPSIADVISAERRGERL